MLPCTGQALEAGHGYAESAWGASTQASSARSIALFSAWHHALGQAADSVSAMRLARATCETDAEKMALALSVFHANELIEQSLSGENTDTGTIRATVTFRADADTVNDAVRAALNQPEMLRFRADLLAYADPVLHEALELDERARIMRKAGKPDSLYADRLSYLAGQLDAVRIVDLVCRHYADTCLHPQENMLLLEQAVRLDPGNIYAQSLLGELYLVLNRPQKALEMFSQSVQNAPEYARAYYGRGLTHLRLHQEILALDDFTRALNLREVPEWLQTRGIAHMLRQENEQMCADFYAACALGECTGLEMVRKKGQCLKTP